MSDELEMETGDLVRFETSKGILTGTVSGAVPGEYCELEFDEKNTMLLNQLYRHCGASIKDGWVKIDLEDGHYGAPEYKVIDEEPGVDLKDPAYRDWVKLGKDHREGGPAEEVS